MSLKGGYQIINLKNLEFNSEMGNSERYPDIYFNMVNSHAKMIIVSGLNMDGVKYNDYETIFYEKDDGDGMYFQAIARRIWNTRDYKCITKYINIFNDDRVTCSQEEFVYEILPDGEFSLTSTNALQNKVITEKFNDIEKVRTLPVESDAAFFNWMGETINTSPIRFSQEGYCDSMGNAVIKIKHIEGVGHVNFHSVLIHFSDNENYQLGRKFDGIMSIRSFARDVSQEKVYRVEGQPNNRFTGVYAIGYPLDLDSYEIEAQASGNSGAEGYSWITIIGKFHD